ncbi:hypothetical protein [Pseudonocardia sp. N23]|uniref:hypothetical protein n=1 Tax=Pseudonocardia sp. N23 TaxID=1987376 RepID=UPI000BFE1E2E|nr:hypothetical protein [Pseudonocardia sp. N23]GAY10156.1 hypothetical protein TOK_4512 [Pseudonocardia sp. N23]
MAEVHLDPDRLRALARRAEVLADTLVGRRPDVPGRTSGRAELERIVGGVRRVAGRLGALAAELRAAAHAAEEVDRAQRDVVLQFASGGGGRSPITDALAGRGVRDGVS